MTEAVREGIEYLTTQNQSKFITWLRTPTQENDLGSIPEALQGLPYDMQLVAAQTLLSISLLTLFPGAELTSPTVYPYQDFLNKIRVTYHL